MKIREPTQLSPDAAATVDLPAGVTLLLHGKAICRPYCTIETMPGGLLLTRDLGSGAAFRIYRVSIDPARGGVH